jgi:hypothetical protein
MDDMIGRVANAIGVGASVEDIHDSLLPTGMSEYDIFLTYQAAKLLVGMRETMKAIPVPKVRRI